MPTEILELRALTDYLVADPTPETVQAVTKALHGLPHRGIGVASEVEASSHQDEIVSAAGLAARLGSLLSELMPTDLADSRARVRELNRARDEISRVRPLLAIRDVDAIGRSRSAANAIAAVRNLADGVLGSEPSESLRQRDSILADQLVHAEAIAVEMYARTAVGVFASRPNDAEMVSRVVLLDRRVEQLERELYLRVIENQDLRAWLDVVELERRRLGAENHQLSQQIGSLRSVLRELEGYSLSLEAQRAQPGFDESRLASLVRLIKSSSHWFADYAIEVTAALTVAGLLALGSSGDAGATEPQVPPPPAQANVYIQNSCDSVLEVLIQPSS